MNDTDPLLRAVAGADPACPDGRALVGLGRLVRDDLPRAEPADLVPGVLARLREADATGRSAGGLTDAPRAPALDGDAIDAFYDRDQGQPEIAGLSQLIHRAGALPRTPDLGDRVARGLRQSGRQGAVATLDGNSRLRLWSAVVAGHFAALLAFTVFSLGGIDHAPRGGPATGGIGPERLDGAGDHDGRRRAGDLLPTRLPGSWAEIAALDADLFVLRRFPELRDDHRARYGMERSRTVVAQGLAWLQAWQDRSSGRYGRPSGDPDRDLATQSLAVLALLGEGLGDHARVASARHGLEWISRQFAPQRVGLHGRVPAGLACLALVEGGLLFGDSALCARAESCLATLDRNEPLLPGAAGLGGFTLLALETAHQGGLRVPGRLLIDARTQIGRSLPSREDDAGRLGLAAFSRVIYGKREQVSTARQIEVLGSLPPAANAQGRVNPLGWFFATLALREAGGERWSRWAADLQAALVDAFVSDGGGQAHVPADRVHYADSGDGAGDVFATSLAVMNLQAAYRYLPMAGAD